MIVPDNRFRAAFLGLCRVLGLLADGDPEAKADELLQIVVGGMNRHAAHRNVAAEMLAALGERDRQGAGRLDGVIEEQLVEIAHPVEQQEIGVCGLDLDILLHHRRCRCPAFLGDQFFGRDTIIVCHGARSI